MKVVLTVKVTAEVDLPEGVSVDDLCINVPEDGIEIVTLDDDVVGTADDYDTVAVTQITE